MTPSRHTPLESSRHLTRKSMAKRDSRPARCFISRPLLQARVPLSTHISDGTMLPGAPAQVVPVPRDAARIESISPCYKQYASPTEACWADRVRMRRTGVRPLHAVCQSERSFSRPSAGARRDCPPRVGPRPGSAWHMGTRSMARLTHRNASAGEALLWVATIPPPALAAGSGPPSILSLVPFPPVTHAPPSILRACPGPCLSVTRLLRFLLRCSSSSHSTLRSQPSHQQTSFPVRESRQAGIANITCHIVSGPAWPHILAARG